MADELNFVREISARLRGELEGKTLKEITRANYEKICTALDSALAHVSKLESQLEEAAKRATELESELEQFKKPLPKLGNLSDLPPELMAELSMLRENELESQIMAVIRDCDGKASIDEILIGLYRKFSVIQKRRFLQNKLGRMCNKEMLWSLSGRKGVYSLDKPADGGNSAAADEDEDEPKI